QIFAANSSAEDCYYLSNETTANGGRTAEQFRSGMVAYELGESWGQTIGTDDYPVLDGEKVYMICGNCYNEGATIDKLVLDDEHDFEFEASVDVKAVEYTRHITTNWNSICLPFGFSVDGRADKAQLFVVDEMDGETVVIRQVTSVEAGKPAILYMPTVTTGGVKVMISATNPVLTGKPDALGDLVGNFGSTVITDANSYYLKDNSFKQCNGNFKLLPYRAYVPGMGGNSTLSFRIVGDNEDVMEEVEDVNADKQIRYIYNVSGQQVNRMNENGIYILMYSDGSTQKVRVEK
ncbi:MAG: hypothetical protein MJZ02_05290, partial [Paludibacteraceae bacterium]|nr:hypothetical protein [Paludibacteraceae bacterium]